MARLGPLPGFPRWTGVRAIATGHRVEDNALAFDLNVRITRRARLWACWHALTGRWPRDAAADQ